MTRFLSFTCDDRAGFKFDVMQANDGDFHVCIRPVVKDLEREHWDPNKFDALFSASVRIRAPMIGGGEHEGLWRALVGLFKDPRARKSGGYREYP